MTADDVHGWSFDFSIYMPFSMNNKQCWYALGAVTFWVRALPLPLYTFQTSSDSTNH